MSPHVRNLRAALKSSSVMLIGHRLLRAPPAPAFLLSSLRFTVTFFHLRNKQTIRRRPLCRKAFYHIAPLSEGDTVKWRVGNWQLYYLFVCLFYLQSVRAIVVKELWRRSWHIGSWLYIWYNKNCNAHIKRYKTIKIC